MPWDREYYDATPVWTGKSDTKPQDHPPRNRLPTGGGSTRLMFIEKKNLESMLVQFISSDECIAVYWTDERRYPMEIWYDQALGTTEDTRASFRNGSDFIELFEDDRVLNITLGKRYVDVAVRKIPETSMFVVSIFEYKSDD